MDSIMPWVGGKNSCADKIVEMMPEHYCYVEVFAGGLWCYFAKPVSKVECVNDLNGELVNFYRVLQRRGKDFEERAKWELYARDLYYEYYGDWISGAHFKMEDVERAFRFFVLIRQAYSAKFGGGWSYGSTRNKPKSFFDVFRDGSVDRVSERLKNTYIDNRDFEDVIKGYDGENTLFMCCLPGTKVRMRDERLLEIEDIIIGDTVFAGGKVLNTMERDYNGNIYKLSILGVYESLNVTEEHPIGVYKIEKKIDKNQHSLFDYCNENFVDRKEIEYMPAKNLKIGDKVLVPIGTENIIEKEKIDDINVNLNYESGWVFGMWLADGTKSEYKVGFDFGVTKVVEKGYDKKLYNWFLSNLGIELSINKYGRKEENRENYWAVRCCSKFISEQFNKLFGSDKIINQEFMNYNLDFQRGLLRGWLDGDGHIADPDGKGQNVEIEGSSRRLDLIEKMYLISLRLGLRPSLSSKYCKSDGGTDYRLVFSNIRDASYLYPELFGNRKARNDNCRKKIVTIDSKKYMVIPIEDIIVEHYEGKVYNLTTENSIYVSNYTLTHNCDPPYVLAPVDDYYYRSMGVSFKQGVNMGFSLYDHQRLYKALSGMKGKFILTIDDCGWVRERYCDGQIELGEGRKFWWVDNEIYYTSSDIENRRVAKELIICNYDIEKQIQMNKGKMMRDKIGGSLADY